ncbi:MAG: outer membrane beta-barrel protein, partial [Thermoanaerobaculia bacterium]|nr:outer membrane beta-barrel protein [Thermoanaerobaculia bacterium]
FGGPEDLSDLDATTETLEGGLTWRLGSRVTLRAGAGTNETTFDESATDRSSEGEHWLAGLDWRRAKLSASVTVRQNDQQGTVGSSFGQFDGTTWQARVNWTPRSRFDLGLYGSRQLATSVEAGQAFFLNERLGVRFGFPIGSRTAASVYYEVGEREYDGAGRVDDTTSVGGDLGVPLGRRIRLRAGARSTRTEGLEGSRTLTQYNFGLSFGSDRRGFF